MSIQIIQLENGSIVARTVCDNCQTTIEEKPARQHQTPGTTLLVGSSCGKCSKKCYSLPPGVSILDVPWIEEVGVAIANVASIKRVELEP